MTLDGVKCAIIIHRDLDIAEIICIFNTRNAVNWEEFLAIFVKFSGV